MPTPGGASGRYTSASGHDALLNAAASTPAHASASTASGGDSANRTSPYGAAGDGATMSLLNSVNSSTVDLAPPPPIHDSGTGGSRKASSNSSTYAAANPRQGGVRSVSRASNVSTTDTFRTASPAFDRRPSITPQLPSRGPFTPAGIPIPPLPHYDDDDQDRDAAERSRPSSRLGAASPSLAVNYVPGKFSTRVFQHDRSQSPAHGGIFASRSSARLRVPPTLPRSMSGSSLGGNQADGEGDDSPDQRSPSRGGNRRLGAVTPFSTAVQRAAAMHPAQAPRLRHSIRRGAGRSAWGPDGGGNPVVGAGDYEDDDGVDLSRSASQRRRQRLNAAHANGTQASEDVMNPGEADRRRTSLLRSNLGHFSEIPDSEEEEEEAEDSELDGDEGGVARGGAALGKGALSEQAGGGARRRKSQRKRSMRPDPDAHDDGDRHRQPFNMRARASSGKNKGGFWGSIAGSRLAYLLGFHDGDDGYDGVEYHEHEDSRYGETVGLASSGGRRGEASGASNDDARFEAARMSMADTSGRPKKRRARWNPFKWTMVLANLVLTTYAIAALIGTLFTWANVWENAATVRVANRVELILSTIAAGLFLVSAVTGWCGILLNNRAFLSIYTVMLWVAFIFMLAPGYMTYKRRSFNLEGKLNQQWSRGLTVAGRLVIQDELNCCGYFSPYVLASASGRCYARSMLPGCKGRFMRFQRQALQYFYICAFSLVGPHLLIITIALLCSNNITYRFGKGLTPKEYRLDEVTAELIKEGLLKNPAGAGAGGREHGIVQGVGGDRSESDLDASGAGSYLKPGGYERHDSYGALSEKGKAGSDEGGEEREVPVQKGNSQRPSRNGSTGPQAIIKAAEEHEMQDLGGSSVEDGWAPRAKVSPAPSQLAPRHAGQDTSPLPSPATPPTAHELQAMPPLLPHQQAYARPDEAGRRNASTDSNPNAVVDAMALNLARTQSNSAAQYHERGAGAGAGADEEGEGDGQAEEGVFFAQ